MSSGNGSCSGGRWRTLLQQCDKDGRAGEREGLSRVCTGSGGRTINGTERQGPEVDSLALINPPPRLGRSLDASLLTM
ncbi:hypothetical protein GGTG_00360 [Gaeumannomyces tritici R3-111a-1]|uniref:Uncharacterized protein n=1 Tax=Gaeumannomyces tritici (strain R3-111a-1) TaxID=644352 RepID=J3NGH0_GAET3|nr:hypothetical protein GGTG_00360 [Gaeumannomyces tritici R3-111a-1]EJT80360.1 hypothetical protein GGTG_00360 [Gaeumannomyces tritici R3-111a-1]